MSCTAEDGSPVHHPASNVRGERLWPVEAQPPLRVVRIAAPECFTTVLPPLAYRLHRCFLPSFSDAEEPICKAFIFDFGYWTYVEQLATRPTRRKSGITISARPYIEHT